MNAVAELRVLGEVHEIDRPHLRRRFHRKAIQEFRVQQTCTKESTMLIKGAAIK